jgi:hypothetical protein
VSTVATSQTATSQAQDRTQAAERGAAAPARRSAASPAARRSGRGRHFSKTVRRGVNSAHVVTSVGLVGVELVMIMMGLMARASGDAAVRHTMYTSMHKLVYVAGIPLAALALVSGVVLCLRTPWGLWKHLWIKVKIVLLFLVIAIGAGVMSRWVRMLEDKTAVGADGSGLAAVQWYQLAGAGVQITALVVATFLSIYKPSGARRGTAERRGSGRP